MKTIPLQESQLRKENLRLLGELRQISEELKQLQASHDAKVRSLRARLSASKRKPKKTNASYRKSLIDVLDAWML